MKKIIIPSMIAKNQKELEKRIKKVKNYTKWLQLDIMDGKFVKTNSINFDFKLPKAKCKFEAHLMIKDPETWINKNAKKVNTIVFHLESTKQPNKIINLIKKKKKKVGIAINPKTPIKKLKPYFRKVDQVMILTVHPGKYGAKFVPSALKKVEELRKLKPKMQIEVDGHINPKTIVLANKAGANRFVSGSYLQKSGNIKKAIENLKKKIN